MYLSCSGLLIAFGIVYCVTAQYSVQSTPFNLIITSKNESLNGTALFAAHSGAAIESLVLSKLKLEHANSTFQTFNFNTSIYQPTINTAKGETGYLTYLLPSQPQQYSEALTFYTQANTNVALPLFEGILGQLLAFDQDGFLNYQNYIDDRTYPATILQSDTKAYYRWFACQSYYLGYQYHTLNWVYGNQRPENPTCEKVMVKRLFV